MEFVILGLLSIRDCTLYDLNKAFEQGISLFYSASYGSLQFALKKLSGGGHISFAQGLENGRNKKTYSITGAGRVFFMEWMFSDIPSNKFEAAALTKLYFLGLVEGKQSKVIILTGIVDKIRRLESELHALDASLSRVTVPEPYEETFRYQMKSLDYGIKAHCFAREWFEDALAALSAQA